MTILWNKEFDDETAKLGFINDGGMGLFIAVTSGDDFPQTDEEWLSCGDVVSKAYPPCPLAEHHLDDLIYYINERLPKTVQRWNEQTGEDLLEFARRATAGRKKHNLPDLLPVEEQTP